MKKGKRNGTCYVDSFNYLIEEHERVDVILNGTPMPESFRPVMDSMRLCHGLVFSPTFKRFIRHAWVKLNDGIVVDAAAKQLLLLARYYELGRVKNVREYTHAEAVANALKYKTYGPWPASKAGA